MQRSRQFFRSVGSGYLLIASLAVVQLLTVPFALHALGRPRLGVCTAVLQVMLFVSVFELGLGPSVARFITDLKDRRDDAHYASFLKTVFLLRVVQGAAILGCAFLFGGALRHFMEIPAELAAEFDHLLWLSLGATAIGFVFSPLQQLVYAHQRLDLLNYCLIASNLVNAAALLASLHAGLGVYSYAVAAWLAMAVTQISLMIAVRHSALLPPLAPGRISLAAIRPMMKLAAEVFLVALGIQLINFAPTVLVTRALGVAALADWSAGTKLLTLAQQLVHRVPGATEPVFWEMYARGESDRLRHRFAQVSQLAAAVAAFAGGSLVAVNSTFVTIWTSGGIEWNWVNDLGCALWLVTSTFSIAWNMVPGITKHLGIMKYVYFGEGLVIMAPGLFGANIPSLFWVPWMLVVAVSVFRVCHGAGRVHSDFAVPVRSILGWALRALALLTFNVALACALRFAFQHWSGWARLVAMGISYSIVAAPATYWLGLPEEARRRLIEAARSLRRRVAA